jgi:lysophospholipase L1-like esterase
VGLRLLIVGDSTAVGTGASAPQHSLAGLIARAHPRLQIDNRARDGATFADLPAQLAGDAHYALVLVQAGGNDVIRLRNLDRVRQDIDRTLALAHARADQVLLMPAGNVGNAAFFFPPLSWWMTQRSRTLHDHLRAAAAHSGATYIDLFKERQDDPFVQCKGLTAADGLHPSDAGYALWLEELRRQASLDSRLAAGRAR